MYGPRARTSAVEDRRHRHRRLRRVLLLGTVFYDAAWPGQMYVVAWMLLPFLLLAMGFVIYFEDRDATADTTDEQSSPEPLAVLRERYARGEIDETEFERRTERLLETQPRARRERASETADGSDGSDRRITRR